MGLKSDLWIGEFSNAKRAPELASLGKEIGVNLGVILDPYDELKEFTEIQGNCSEIAIVTKCMIKSPFWAFA
jgi:hypothetical protein